jgi:glycosyltransferase involved in cell wall biosynthesis
MEVKVSVIVPNYNHSLYLKQRLDSIMGQTFRNFELIILDDKSIDGSAKIIEQYRHMHKVTHIEYNTKNSGSTFAQWEKGLNLAKGEWVWIAESDDYADPHFLETMINLTNQETNIGIAFCSSHWVNQHSEIKEDLSLYKESFFRTGFDEIRSLCNHCTIQNASSALIKKKLALDAVKNLSQYKACGDWIFYTRILHHSNIIYTAQKLNYFRWYHTNVSNTNKGRLWALEGVQVLENVDYKTIKFTKISFFNIIRRWAYKAMRLNFKDSVKTWHSIFNASTRFLFS